MLVRIEEETRHHHGVADGHRLALLEVTSESAYGAFLARIAGFERSVEVAFANAPGIDPTLAGSHLRTDHLLAADLPALGVGLEVVLDRPTFCDAAEALGWLYVLQRNTLVHGLIARQLARTLSDTTARAARYLTVFEGNAGARMFELGMVLDRAANRSAIADRIVAATHEAFRVQRMWYTSLGESRFTPRRVPVHRAA